MNEEDQAARPSGVTQENSWQRRCLRLARLVACNVVGLALALAAILAGGEAWRRVSVPFAHRAVTGMDFVPAVGLMIKPHAEMRSTNQRDFWTIARANRLGFLDRDPPSASRASAACHVAVVGDSFVEASEVAIEDKLQVRFEALATEHRPELDVVATGFGRSGTGQLAQLALYDEYVRALAPKLVALVFHGNDFRDNFGPFRMLEEDLPPDRGRFQGAVPDGAGSFRLVPPSADFLRFRARVYKQRWTLLGLASKDGNALFDRLADRAARHSWFVRWLGEAGMRELRPARERIQELLREAPEISLHWEDLSWVEGMAAEERLEDLFRRPQLPPALAAGLDYTAFGFAEFRRRAERDGFALVLLATEAVGTEGMPMFDRLRQLADAEGIDVVSAYDHILRQGGTLEQARWPHNSHWSPAGHRWAAEALFDYVRDRPGVCAAPGGEPAATEGAGGNAA